MDTAAFAAMADPDRNPKFSRRWIELPLPRAPGPAAEVTLDDIAVLISEDFRSARVRRDPRHGNGAHG